MNSSEAEGWELRDVPLQFGFGDWIAFRFSLKLCSRSVRIGSQCEPMVDPQPPAPPLPSQAVGYLIRALPVAVPLPPLTTRDTWLRYVTVQYTHCYIDLSLDLETYRSKFSGKTRQTIMRKIRKFEEHCGGTLDWRTYRTPSEMREFHRLARDVSARTYQEKLLDAGIPNDAAFVEQMLERASHDESRGWLLFDRERPVSYLYCPAEAGALIYAYLGYDPDYMKFSVGTVLQWLAVEQLYQERRFRLFDFTEGQSDHKRLFATHEVHCANVMFVKDSLPRRFIIRMHALNQRLSSAAGAMAERWGLKARLRRLLRFGFASGPAKRPS